ncbi:MAG: cell division protein SepF [Clostridia bacterium]|nr:cell division protein SepF [Clostridia bacterium]
MGFFDFLSGKKQTESTGVSRTSARSNSHPEAFTANSNIATFKPTSFEDVAEIIDCLLEGKPAIVNLTEVRENTAQRVVDLLSGAIYAINGNLCELQKEVYIFTPNGVKTN